MVFCVAFESEKLKINHEDDHTSEPPCGKNPLMKPKDWYAPNAGIWKMSRE